MISLYLKEYMKIRGFVAKPATLARWGITYALAKRLLANNVETINLKILERLCVALDCLPTELLNYKPEINTVPPGLQIHKLTKPHVQPSLTDFNKVLNPEQMKEALIAIEHILYK